MIDFRYVLIVVFTLMIFVIAFSEKSAISKAMLYIASFGFFFLGLDLMINGIVEVSIFLSSSVGIVLWAFGIINLIRLPTKEIEEEW
jgi:hypothetical protein